MHQDIHWCEWIMKQQCSCVSKAIKWICDVVCENRTFTELRKTLKILLKSTIELNSCNWKSMFIINFLVPNFYDDFICGILMQTIDDSIIAVFLLSHGFRENWFLFSVNRILW